MICNSWSTTKNQQFRIDNRNILQAEFTCLFTIQLPASFRKQTIVSGTRERRFLHGRSPGIIANNGPEVCSSLGWLINSARYWHLLWIGDNRYRQTVDRVIQRNNSDVFYKYCPDYMAFSRPRAGCRLVSLVINCAEKFKRARTGHRMAFTQSGSMNNRNWIG